MLGKFRFQARGYFTQEGDVLREDLLGVCRDLYLVGWIKCRRSFAIGHLQGDVCALSYMRRYLEKYREDVHAVSFYEENFGMPAVEYERVTAVNDYRAPAKKRQHAIAAAEKMKATRLQQESLREVQELANYYEDHCMRNY
ncbi:hypothetical protein CSUI_002787 [Cystoisospora suis]|uniref:Acylphosphatase-like domain-containing protein n=1 Tax=Cystoisospora suis TaxID=483139 RepID=A0A2C6KSP2_9APIC|nr:hypothetical protein CSUI_002787 [Cystoisospora suis]